jgi:pyrimidine-specific ribonucleoside hydrolase
MGRAKSPIVRHVASGIAAFVALGVAGCGSTDNGSATADASDAPVRLVIDTDGGSDDAIALLYLLQHPGVDVVAITVSGTGIVRCDPGVANVAGLIELASPTAEIPVACGQAEPITGNRAFPNEWRDQADDRYGGTLPSGSPPSEEATAVDVMRTALSGAAGPTTVLTLGPLTNLAALLAAEPEIVSAIDEVVVMGGALDVPGNVQLPAEPGADVAEWNIYVDPMAARTVLESSVPITLVPLDSQVPVDPYVVRALADSSSTPPARTVAELLQSSPFFVSGAFFLWDPLAAAVVADPDAFLLQPRRATVVTGGPQAGRTISGEGADITVARIVGVDDFLGTFLGVLDGRTSDLPVPRIPDARVTVSPDGCRLDPTTVEGGPAVLGIGTTGAAAVGTIEEGRTDDEIDEVLASNPAQPPPWFDLVTLLQPIDGRPSTSFVDLRPGELDVVCVRTDTAAPTVTGRARLTVRGE